jgi:hypothetical protein
MMVEHMSSISLARRRLMQSTLVTLSTASLVIATFSWGTGRCCTGSAGERGRQLSVDVGG